MQAATGVMLAAARALQRTDIMRPPHYTLAALAYASLWSQPIICLSACIAQCLIAVGQCTRAGVCMHVCFAMLRMRARVVCHAGVKIPSLFWAWVDLNSGVSVWMAFSFLRIEYPSIEKHIISKLM